MQEEGEYRCSSAANTCSHPCRNLSRLLPNSYFVEFPLPLFLVSTKHHAWQYTKDAAHVAVDHHLRNHLCEALRLERKLTRRKRTVLNVSW